VRQAIKTKFLGPTETKPARIRAECDASAETTPYDHSLDADQNHIRAAKTLANNLGWSGRWHGGGMEDEYFFVCEADVMAFKIS